MKKTTNEISFFSRLPMHFDSGNWLSSMLIPTGGEAESNYAHSSQKKIALRSFLVFYFYLYTSVLAYRRRKMKNDYFFEEILCTVRTAYHAICNCILTLYITLFILTTHSLH